MKGFEDIIWKQHEVCGIGSIQGMLTLDNGIEFSVIAGKSTYGSKNFGMMESDFITFEVAIYDKNGDMVGNPIGWQNRKEIDKLIMEQETKN
tara:strand:- start:100 stop:375 length:276 start_codon:yes stop_codon:yes gene_type:complete